MAGDLVSAASASAHPAGPGTFIVLGAAGLVVGTLVATDYRGWGTKYIQLALRRTDVISPARARFIRRDRVRFAVAAAIGLSMLVVGIFSLV